MSRPASEPAIPRDADSAGPSTELTLRLFFEQYVRSRGAIVDETLRASPIFQRTAVPSSDGPRPLELPFANDLVADAILTGQWEPYDARLRAWVEEQARQGIGLGDWSKYLGAFRRAARRSFMLEIGDDFDTLHAVTDGMEVLLAHITSIVWESYSRGVSPQVEERGLLYAGVVEHLHDAVITKALDGTITGWNAGAERLYGYTADEILGKNIIMLVPEQKLPELMSLMAGLRDGRRVENLETLRRTRDGALIDVSLTISPIRTATGTFIGAFSVARDITTQRRSAELFRLVVEACPVGLVMTDSAGLIRLANAEAVRMTGYARDDLVGQPLDALVPQAFKARLAGLRQSVTDATDDGTSVAPRELVIRRQDGTEVQIELSLRRVGIGGEYDLIGMMVDVTGRRIAEERLRQQAEDLKRSNEELAQFAYVASHDLQEPLRSVVSFTELIEESYDDRFDERGRLYMRHVVEGGKRMQALISDLLAYSRVGTQGKPMRPTSTRTVLIETLDSLGALIEANGATVTYGDLPTVLADRLQLGQVFQNLIDNAIKFRGQQPPAVHIDAQSEDGMWRFSVTDNGIGIRQADAVRIFQMFQRLHERGRYDGNGIGLALCKRIVERHHGRIWFESAPARGTVFLFTLPAVQQTSS